MPPDCDPSFHKKETEKNELVARPDLVLGEVQGAALGHLKDGPLGGVVGHETGLSNEGAHGGQVDDGALAAGGDLDRVTVRPVFRPVLPHGLGGQPMDGPGLVTYLIPFC